MTLVAVVDVLAPVVEAWLRVLVQASLEGALLGALVWAVCRTLPALPAAVRTWLWWLVALDLLLGLLPLPGVRIPVLPLTESRTVSRQVLELPSPIPVPRADATAPRPGISDAPARPAPTAEPLPHATISYGTLLLIGLAGAWLAGVILHARGVWRALGASRRLRHSADPAPASIARRVLELVRAFALPVVPEVLASRLSAVPFLTGVLRPAIVLPAQATTSLSRQDLDLVLGHELAHVRRGDLVWGWVPALASRLFFFHPLARLAMREYLAAREEACDAEVLQVLDAEPAAYARLLITLGVAPTDDVLAAAGTSPTFDALKRRLIMLDRSTTPASRWWWALAGATAAVVPLTLAAQGVAPSPTAAAAAAAEPVARVSAVATVDAVPSTTPRTLTTWRDGADQPVPPTPPEPVAPPTPPVPRVDTDGLPPDTPPPPPPAPPAPPVPPAPPEPPHERLGGREIRSPWVLVDPTGRTVMSGMSDDQESALALKGRTSGRYLWFRYGGTPYVTEDPQVIASLERALQPVRAVSGRMRDVGQKMGAEGSRQGELGARQGELAARQAALAAGMSRTASAEATLAAEEARLARRHAELVRSGQSDADAQRAAVQAEREALHARRQEARNQRHAAEQQAHAEMKALAEQQRALGAQMGRMGSTLEQEGARMRTLGDQLGQALAAADDQATAVFGEAVKAGKARPVK